MQIVKRENRGFSSALREEVAANQPPIHSQVGPHHWGTWIAGLLSRSLQAAPSTDDDDDNLHVAEEEG